MQKRQLQLSLLKDSYGICKFPSDSSIPEWALKVSLCSITRSEKELTIVCLQGIIPANTEYDSDWRCFRIGGSFDFNQIGVISSLAAPLAEAGVSIFVVSTYDTDYVLVKEEKIEQAVNVLTDNGHLIAGEE
ncbi:MAG: ACT domain-containing protein [Phycisphaerales bacterium]